MAQRVPITRMRGDTYRIRITFTIESTGAALDLSGATLLMTVAPIAEPDEASDALFELQGSIVDPATDGIADFTLSADQADNVGDFFYDVEMTDVSSAVRTILSGSFTMIQDITKSDDSGVIEFSGETPGESILKDGTGIFYPTMFDTDGSMTYETRDARIVIRNAWVSYQYSATLAFGGATSPFPFLKSGVRIKTRVYFDGSGHDIDYISIGVWDRRPGVGYANYADMSISAIESYLSIRSVEEGFLVDDEDVRVEAHTPGWYWLGLEIHEDGSILADAWADGSAEPSPYTLSLQLLVPWVEPLDPCLTAYLKTLPQVSIMEWERIEWERI